MNLVRKITGLFKKRLGSEIAGPTESGVRQALSGHPSFGLNPRRLASLLRRAEEGDEIPYLELAEEMEEKDCHYRAVLSTRKIQVSGLEMSVEAASDRPEDVEAADLCREIFPVIRPALFDVMDAVGKGFSVSEIIWDLSATPVKPARILWRDPRWFGFDPATGAGPFLRGETGLLEELVPDKFIVHMLKSKSGLPIRGGLARAAAWAWMFKNFDLESWNIFCEVYGHPLRLGKYDIKASEKDRNVLLRAVRDLGRDAAAIIPDSMEIEFVPANVQGNSEIFQRLAEYLDMQISKLVLGQTGTTDTGSRVGTADAHERVRADIEAADAAALSSTITRDVLTPLIRFNFGPDRAVPQFSLHREKKEDLAALADILAKLAPIAPRLAEVSVIRDKLGFPDPAPDAVCLGDNRPDGANEIEVVEETKNANIREKAGEDVRQAAESLPENRDWIDDLADESLEEWVPVMEPIREQLAALAATCATFEEFRAKLAALAATLDTSGLADVLASAMFAARVSGERENA